MYDRTGERISKLDIHFKQKHFDDTLCEVALRSDINFTKNTLTENLNRSWIDRRTDGQPEGCKFNHDMTFSSLKTNFTKNINLNGMDKRADELTDKLTEILYAPHT